LTARATTSSATTSEMASCAIIKSLDHDGRDQPPGISGPELRRQDRAQAAGGQHGQCHRPPPLPDPV
jgi:hypothetical protein